MNITTSSSTVVSNNSYQQYDPNVVIAEANQKLINGDWEGGQFIFQSYLLEWTDDAREGGGGGGDVSNRNSVLDGTDGNFAAVSSSSLSSPIQLQEAICTLYIAYAQYLIAAKQYKTATLAYEDAIQSSTILQNSIGRIYQEYTRFLLERDKRKSAQEIFIKALVANNGGAVHDEQDRDILWNDFLEMMQINNPQLTMKTLRQAMTEQSNNASSNIKSNDLPPPSKRQKITTDADDVSVYDGSEGSKTHVVMLESVEEEAMRLVEQWSSSILTLVGNSTSSSFEGLPPDVMAAWISRDGNDIPTPPHPPLFAPSPPKLSDPTAKDMIGIDLAVKIIQRLLSPSGGITLEICRALWMIHGMCEQTQYETLHDADSRFHNDHERLESELEARLSVAGTNISQAVTLMNERERTIFHHQANQQRQQLVNQSAWSFRQLLYIQQVVLNKLDMPGFEDGPTVDVESLLLQSYICQYIHSAFYIRNRMGGAAHESMLRSQLKKLLREQEQQQQIGSHSPKINSVTANLSNPMSRKSPLVPSAMQQYQATSTPMMPQMLNQPYTNAYQHHAVYQQQSQLQPIMTLPNGMPPPYPQQATMMYSYPPPMLPQQQQQQQPQPYLQQQQPQLLRPPQMQYGSVPQQQQPPPLQYPPYYQQQ